MTDDAASHRADQPWNEELNVNPSEVPPSDGFTFNSSFRRNTAEFLNSSFCSVLNRWLLNSRYCEQIIINEESAAAASKHLFLCRSKITGLLFIHQEQMHEEKGLWNFLQSNKKNFFMFR